MHTSIHPSHACMSTLVQTPNSRMPIHDTCMHIHTYIFKQTNKQKHYKHPHTQASTFICMHACMYACIYPHMQAPTYKQELACMHTHIIHKDIFSPFNFLIPLPISYLFQNLIAPRSR